MTDHPNRSKRLLRACALMLSLVASAPAYAIDPTERLADTVLEQRAREISANLRCLVCQNQSIDDSDAPLARDLRVVVRERLKAGDSNGEVVDYVVGRYGEFILLKPRFGFHTALLWIAPVLLLAAGLLIAYVSLWSNRSRNDARRAEPLTPAEREQLEIALRERQKT